MHQQPADFAVAVGNFAPVALVQKGILLGINGKAFQKLNLKMLIAGNNISNSGKPGKHADAADLNKITDRIGQITETVAHFIFQFFAFFQIIEANNLLVQLHFCAGSPT